MYYVDCRGPEHYLQWATGSASGKDVLTFYQVCIAAFLLRKLLFLFYRLRYHQLCAASAVVFAAARCVSPPCMMRRFCQVSPLQ